MVQRPDRLHLVSLANGPLGGADRSKACQPCSSGPESALIELKGSNITADSRRLLLGREAGRDILKDRSGVDSRNIRVE